MNRQHAVQDQFPREGSNGGFMALAVTSKVLTEKIPPSMVGHTLLLIGGLMKTL
jgi:hypothetical protein